MTTKKTAAKAAAAKTRAVKALVKAINAPAAKKKSATKAVARWCLGVFASVAHDGQRIVTYVRRDGSVVPYMAAKVKTKKALFHGVYRGVRYAEARAQVLKDAAKAGVK